MQTSWTWLYCIVYIVVYISSGCIKDSTTVLKIWSQTSANSITWKHVINAILRPHPNLTGSKSLKVTQQPLLQQHSRLPVACSSLKPTGPHTQVQENQKDGSKSFSCFHCPVHTLRNLFGNRSISLNRQHLKQQLRLFHFCESLSHAKTYPSITDINQAKHFR